MTSSPQIVRPASDTSNQVSPLTGYNLFLTDRTLAEAVERGGASWARDEISELGKILGAAEAQNWGAEANENPPVLHTHDRNGNRLDEVLFHPSWHRLMKTSIGHRLHSLPWLEHKKGAHVARAALMMMTVQNEAGHTCPVSMTFSGLAPLRSEPELAREWEPRILSAAYDPRFMPAPEKRGVLLGMGMTEKQGGSDVRANTTRAVRIGNSREYFITGHKWFCSAPMCDAFLILAQTDKGLSCFFLPRWTPSGEKNKFFIQRLKDKMGNRSNASSEVEFDSAWAHLVGEEGRGISTIIEMVNYTRLDCAVASAGLMRQALVQALHHCLHRKAFGKLLIDQPLMRNVLADLVLESEAATLLAIRLAASFDARESDEHERAFSRIATAVSKYWLCKRSPVHVGEALECLGGNGYVEESGMPRLYREAPLYGIWEGSGNVICLDILRALAKEPDTVDAVLQELHAAEGSDPRLNGWLAQTETDLTACLKSGLNNGGSEAQIQARRLAERLALALQALLMVRHGRPPVADAFIASRLMGDHGHTFGTLGPTLNLSPILDSATEAFIEARH
ncbi:MAG TPA: isovaleryl-CoA dehydrogenase [Candidatus Acidoferrales bacterium]|jgi:putative acyl-CoA dehydrogenase|nr:isovaleryl-CoA dehydrogenase [Candidatus Acidoferrales bacterium]